MAQTVPFEITTEGANGSAVGSEDREVFGILAHIDRVYTAGQPAGTFDVIVELVTPDGTVLSPPILTVTNSVTNARSSPTTGLVDNSNVALPSGTTPHVLAGTVRVRVTGANPSPTSPAVRVYLILL